MNDVAERSREFAGSHMASSSQLVQRAKGQDTEQDTFCARLGELETKCDSNDGSHLMIENGALFVISPSPVDNF
jgi:hypothetical protein